MRKHSFKLLPAILAPILLLTACTGCPAVREEHAKEALEAKYGKTFEIQEVFPQGIGQGYYGVTACAEDDPDLPFTAYVDTGDDNVSDSYVEKIVCREIEEILRGNLNGLETDFDLYVHAVGPQPVVSDTGISIEEYAAMDPQNKFNIELFVRNDVVLTNLYINVFSMLQGLECLRGDLRVVFVPEEGTMGELMGYVQTHETLDISYQMLIKDLLVHDFTYENGLVEDVNGIIRGKPGKEIENF